MATFSALFYFVIKLLVAIYHQKYLRTLQGERRIRRTHSRELSSEANGPHDQYRNRFQRTWGLSCEGQVGMEGPCHFNYFVCFWNFLGLQEFLKLIVKILYCILDKKINFGNYHIHCVLNLPRHPPPPLLGLIYPYQHDEDMRNKSFHNLTHRVFVGAAIYYPADFTLRLI